MINKKIFNVVSVYFSISYFFGDQLKYFTDKGYQVYLGCSKSDKLHEFCYEQGVVSKEFVILRKFSIFQDLKTTYEMYKYIKKNNFDIVVGHSPKGALIAMLSSYLANTNKRVYFRHGLPFETSKGLKRFLLIAIEKLTSRLANQVVCVSESIKEISLSNKLNSRHKNIILGKGTCNGINIEKYKRSDDFIKSNKNFVVGFVGRIVCDKGIVELIEAWKLLLLTETNITLLLVGPFEERDSIPYDVKQYILNENSIKHVGFVEDTVSYYKEMDLFVLPSFREGFSTSVLEASSMELPVITSKNTGCIDTIIPNETGVFTEVNPIEISKSIKMYLNNRSLCKKHGLRGRKFVEEYFRQEFIWNEIEKQIYL